MPWSIRKVVFSDIRQYHNKWFVLKVTLLRIKYTRESMVLSRPNDRMMYMDKQKMDRMDSTQRLNMIGIDRIMEVLDIKPDDEIMDVGACTGAFSLPMAKETSQGHVYAIDVDDEPLEVLKRKILRESIDNIVPIHVDNDLTKHQHDVFNSGIDILGVEEDSVDKIFMCTVLHEIEDKERFLEIYHQFLKPDGKIYVVEFGNRGNAANQNQHGGRGSLTEEDTLSFLQNAGYTKPRIIKINEMMYMAVAEK